MNGIKYSTYPYRKWITYFLLICGVIFIVAALLFIGYKIGSQNEEKPPQIEYKTDTLIVVKRDTVKVVKKVKEYRYDTVVVDNSVYIRDSLQHYIDSTDTYKIDIEAVRLDNYKLDVYRSDSLMHITDSVFIYKEKKDSWWKNRFVVTAGVGAGYGLINKNFDCYVGVGVGIRLW